MRLGKRGKSSSYPYLVAFFFDGVRVFTPLLFIFLALVFSPPSVFLDSLVSWAFVPSLAGADGFFIVGAAVAAEAVDVVAISATEISAAVSNFFIGCASR